MDSYDVVVIGAGPGGYVSAIRASQLGLKTAIVDKQWLGGVCLNVGCIPSKALLKNAEVALLLREKGKDLGFSFENLVLDYSAAVKRSRQVSDRLTKGVGFLMKKNNIDVVMGSAKFLSPTELEVVSADGTKQSLKSKNFVIATGSHPIAVPGVKVDGTSIVTYHEAILQTSMPSSVVIIGAGAIGLEFATVWSSFGSEVTLVEMLPRIAPMEDEEISKELARAFSKRGIQIMTGTKVKSAATVNGKVEVVVEGEEGLKTLTADQALVAIGFRPNVADLGLEAAGVKLTERGHIEINDQMATNVPGIWAIGDVTGKFLLAHVASTQGILCAEAIAGKPVTPIDYAMVPRATYSNPQIASFGYTEEQAKAKGYDIKIGRMNMIANGKALGLGESSGFCKVIVDAKYGEILGAHLIGTEVSELLPELTLAQKMELTIEEISRNIHAHPTLSEVVLEAAHSAMGQPIHA